MSKGRNQKVIRAVALGACFILSACKPEVQRYKAYNLGTQYPGQQAFIARGISDNGLKIAGCFPSSTMTQMGSPATLDILTDVSGHIAESYPGTAATQTNLLTNGNTTPMQNIVACAEDVNDSGQIVGRSAGANYTYSGSTGLYWPTASIYDQPIKLGDLTNIAPDPLAWSVEPQKINNNGFIVGSISPAYGPRYTYNSNGVAWHAAGPLTGTYLPSIKDLGNGLHSDVNAINFATEEVSFSDFAHSYELTGISATAYTYPQSTSAGYYGRLAAINDSNAVLAFTGTALPTGFARAETQPVILYPNGTNKSLSPLSTPSYIQQARLLNDETVIVAASDSTSPTTETYIWTSDTKRRLADLVVDSPNFPSAGSHMKDCKITMTDANNHGDIVGQARCGTNQMFEYSYLFKRVRLGDYDQDGQITCEDVYQNALCKSRFGDHNVASYETCSIFDYDADGDIDSDDDKRFGYDSDQLSNCPLPPQ